MSEILSPVEERHIDYILEEEFCVSPDFLVFFIQQARASAPDTSRIPDAATKHGCKAVRSVTTTDGESDVLVTYSASADLPIALLIEDKIRAGFQKNQVGRYRERGDAGKGSTWSDYWTCLVAHEKYTTHPGDFDGVVTLQQLQAFFAARADERSQFRARILQQAINKYQSGGLQQKDDVITRFRQRYAAEFDARLPANLWWHEPARDAWWGDRWFECRGISWPKGVLIRHKTEPGHIELVFPFKDEPLFRDLINKYAAWHTYGTAPVISLVVVGKAKAKMAFRLQVTPVQDFASEATPYEEFFSAIEYLGNFYARCVESLPPEFRFQPVAQQHPQADATLAALNIMLLSYMRSSVICHGSAMPFPLPRIEKLSEATPEEERHFATMGLMGSFGFALSREPDGKPYIIATLSSRQWGTFQIQHIITTDEIRMLPDK